MVLEEILFVERRNFSLILQTLALTPLYRRSVTGRSVIFNFPSPRKYLSLFILNSVRTTTNAYPTKESDPHQSLLNQILHIHRPVSVTTTPLSTMCFGWLTSCFVKDEEKNLEQGAFSQVEGAAKPINPAGEVSSVGNAISHLPK
jgi:hypothetical protein